MKRILSLIMSVFLVIPALTSCGGARKSEHQHSYKIVVHQPTCTEDGYTEYICDCGDSYKEDIMKATGHDYMLKDYSLFLGSSIFHGHLKGHSFVDMLKEDYIKLERNGETSYLKRNDELEKREKYKDSKVYKCDQFIVSINNDKKSGTIDNVNVTFENKGESLHARQGHEEIAVIQERKADENVYKLTANGASMAYFTPEELKPQGNEYERRSYWYRLTEYAKDIEKVNNFYLQLSTNDAAWASKGAVNFGEILPDNIKNVDAFDYTTSFGAMEYMIAWARERWNCRVTVVVCPYINTSGDYGRYYSQLVEKVPEIKKKWNVSVIDLYHNQKIYENVTNTNSAWLDQYMYPDRVHLTDLGYESWILPEFRKFMDADGWEKDEKGNEYRICGKCGQRETR